jgi:hypothetical protein
LEVLDLSKNKIDLRFDDIGQPIRLDKLNLNATEITLWKELVRLAVSAALTCKTMISKGAQSQTSSTISLDLRPYSSQGANILSSK